MVLVTGANGFVGRAVVKRLMRDAPTGVRAAVRTRAADVPAGVEKVEVGDVHGTTDWREALRGVRAVVHLAARVHVMRDRSADPLADFRRVNVSGTLQLA